MTLLLSIIILSFLKESLQDCVIDNRTPENAWEQDLQEMLKKKRFDPPSLLNSSNFEVYISFTMKSFSFDSSEQTFSVFSWIFLRWHHDKLKWNPADYGGITETVLTTMDIWVPSLRLLNGFVYDEYDHIANNLCRLKSDGAVNCVPRFDDRAICKAVLINWPYDRQTCTLEFGGSCKGVKNKIRLRFGKRAIAMFGAKYGSEWDIMDYKQEEDQNARAQLKMFFILERHADSLAAVVIYPSIILSTLSVTSLIIDVRNRIRIWLICFNLVNHFTFLSELQQEVPRNSTDVPTILLYYRGSVIVTVLLIFLTKGLDVMCKKKETPPIWMNSMKDSISGSRFNWIVWPHWEHASRVDENTKLWVYIANLVNTVCLLATVLTYICLYLVFMPQPPAMKY